MRHVKSALTIIPSTLRKIDLSPGPRVGQTHAHATAPARNPMGHPSTPVSVLLVEDEVLISHLVAEYLSESGFDVHEVTTADAALEYIDSGAAVDVLFTDINLPGSMNGAELAQRARKRRPDLPIVYASGRFAASDIGP